MVLKENIFILFVCTLNTHNFLNMVLVVEYIGIYTFLGKYFTLKYKIKNRSFQIKTKNTSTI